MTNPTTAEKVPVYVHSEKNMMPIGIVGAAKRGYVDLDDYKALTAELASLRRERDGLAEALMSAIVARGAGNGRGDG